MKQRFNTASAFLSGYWQAKRYRSLSHKSLEKRRQILFDQFKARVLAHSSFYQAYLDQPLSAFPILNKKEHVNHFNHINTANLDRDKALDIAISAEQSRDFSPLYGQYSVGLSSGTSGNRGLFVVSPQERAQWAGYIIQRLKPTVFGKDRVALFLRANNQLYERVNGLLLEFCFFDLLQGVKAHIKALEAFQPTVLIAPSSVLMKIAAYQANITPKKVIAAAEVLDDQDKRVLENHFQQVIHQIYQCTEGFLGASCEYGHVHLNEDMFIIEKHWLDKASGRFSPIITDLKRRTQPIVRYLLDDVLIEDPTPCPCGSSFTRLKRIEGRKDDILLLQHRQTQKIVDVFPDFIRNTIIAACPDLLEYQVVQLDKQTLKLSISPWSQQLEMQIKHSLGVLWHELQVEVPRYLFSDYQLPPLGQKQRRVMRLAYD